VYRGAEPRFADSYLIPRLASKHNFSEHAALSLSLSLSLSPDSYVSERTTRSKDHRQLPTQKSSPRRWLSTSTCVFGRRRSLSSTSEAYGRGHRSTTWTTSTSTTIDFRQSLVSKRSRGIKFVVFRISSRSLRVHGCPKNTLVFINSLYFICSIFRNIIYVTLRRKERNLSRSELLNKKADITSTLNFCVVPHPRHALPGMAGRLTISLWPTASRLERGRMMKFDESMLRCFADRGRQCSSRSRVPCVIHASNSTSDMRSLLSRLEV